MGKMKPKLVEKAKDLLRTGVTNIKVRVFFELLLHKFFSSPQIFRKI